MVLIENEIGNADENDSHHFPEKETEAFTAIRLPPQSKCNRKVSRCARQELSKPWNSARLALLKRIANAA